MAKKLSFITIWFFTATIVLLLNVTYLTALKKGSSLSPSYNPFTFHANVSTNSLESTGKVLGTSVESGDARKMILKNFITRYQPTSPFTQHIDFIVDIADTYGIDFRLVPAIAMCESNMGSRMPTKDSFNAWGIAVYTGQQNGKKFNDWPHAIEWVTKYIKEKYYDRGITDLRDIGAIWAPPSVNKEYSWTRCVELFLQRMQ